jgi:hypothetical protein
MTPRITVRDDNGHVLGYAARVIDLASGSPQQREPVVTCRGCLGKAVRRDGESPAGWYQLSVSVPEWIDHKGYVWVGIFCSVACLALAVPKLEHLERLAHEAYDPVPPEHPVSAP